MNSRHVSVDQQDKSIVLAANTSWNLVNFRAPVIAGLQDRGYRVVAAASEDSAAGALRDRGVEVHHIDVDSRGLSPWRDGRLLIAYAALLRKLRPAAFLPFTAKPNIYGSIAAGRLGIPVVNTITGLGTGFINGGPLEAIISRLYRWSLRRSQRVFFHNDDDRDLFIKRRIANASRARVVPGSGVDIDYFKAASERPANAPLTFLFIGRLLKTKGALEFTEAAAKLAQKLPARFKMLGPVEEPPDAVPREALDPLVARGIIELLGTTDDVRSVIADSDCVVLPSYREGMPRVVLEASAMARVVITTDVPGCRQAVDHGVTGFLCEPRSGEALAEAMQAVADLSREERRTMGLEGRRKVEREFSDERVVDAYLDALSSIGLRSRSGTGA